MHLQEIFDLTFIQGQGHMKHCPLHHVTYVPAKLLRPMVKEMHYQKNTLFDLDPKVKGVKVTQNVAQYPQHHLTYEPAKFLCCYIPWLRRRCIYKKIHYLTLNPRSRSHEMLPSTFDIM